MFTNVPLWLLGTALAAPFPGADTVVVLPDGADSMGAVVSRTWENGTVVVAEDHRVPLVSVTLTFRTGSADRWWYENDLDYLWSTLIRPELNSERDPRFSAWAGGHTCGLSFSARPTEVQGMMDLVHARLVTEYEDHQARVRVVRARRFWRTQLGSPKFVLAQAIARAFFQATDPRRMDYERPELRRTKEIDLDELRDSIVAADGWVWSFAGDINVETAETLVARTLPGPKVLGKARELESTPLPPRLAAAGHSTFLGLPGIEEVVTALARPGLGLADPQADAALLADAVVVRRLEQVVRQGRGDSYAFSTEGLLAIAPDVYVLTSMTSPERIAGHRDAVRAELARISTDGLTVDEIERVRRVLRMMELRNSQAPNERAQFFVRDLNRSILAPGSQDLGRRYLSVAAERVSSFARQFYAPDAFAEFAVGPSAWAKAEQKALEAARKASEHANPSPAPLPEPTP